MSTSMLVKKMQQSDWTWDWSLNWSKNPLQKEKNIHEADVILIGPPVMSYLQ